MKDGVQFSIGSVVDALEMRIGVDVALLNELRKDSLGYIQNSKQESLARATELCNALQESISFNINKLMQIHDKFDLGNPQQKSVKRQVTNVKS